MIKVIDESKEISLRWRDKNTAKTYTFDSTASDINIAIKQLVDKVKSDGLNLEDVKVLYATKGDEKHEGISGTLKYMKNVDYKLDEASIKKR